MDPERDLRDMMSRTADGVRHVPRPSRELVRRARLRRVRTAAIAGTTAFALVVGGFAGARWLSSDEATPPAGPDSSPEPTHRETSENATGSGTRYEILDGAVTFRAADPWGPSLQTSIEIGERNLPELTLVKNGMERSIDGDPVTADGDPVKNSFDYGGSPSEAAFVVHADPGPPPLSCSETEDPPVTSSDALAGAIGDDPRLDSTELVAERIAGLDAIRLDAVPTDGAPTCSGKRSGFVPALMARGHEKLFLPHIHGLSPGERMRLYLLDLAGGDARTLSIMIVAPEANFNAAIAAARPILDSFEF